jgi:ABC-type bacteriocin/lantibiotic exporter with double-glycine peptidase domain
MFFLFVLFFLSGELKLAALIILLFYIVLIIKIFSRFFSEVTVEMDKAKPKGLDEDYAVSLIESLGDKASEMIFSPRTKTYKANNLSARAGQGAKNFIEGIKKIFRF